MSNMSNASNNVPDIGTGRTKRKALPSSRATASRETEAAAAAAAAPEKSKARFKPQRRMTQQPPKKSTAPHKAPVSKAVAIPEAPGFASEEQESEEPESEEQELEENDESSGFVDVLGPKFTKADKETLEKLLALKKQADTNQRSQAVAGNIFFSF